MENLLRDLRFALRMLRNSPGFAIAVVLSLALGIGANTTVFSLINSLLLRPVPAERPEQLVRIYRGQRVGSSFNYPDFVVLKENSRTLSGICAFSFLPVNYGHGEDARRIQSMIVSENYFYLLGIRPAAGRFFSSDENIPGASPYAVVSYAFWEKEMGRSALGSGWVELNGFRYEVIGVTPRGFYGTEVGFAPDVWLPISMYREILPHREDALTRSSSWLLLLGRLKPGQTMNQARSELQGLTELIDRQYPVESEERSGVTLSDPTGITPEVRTEVLLVSILLLAVVGLVLLIACANIANLMLARGIARNREFAVRLALGSSRLQLIRLFLLESFVLSAAGGAAGWILAAWTRDLVLKLIPVLPVPVSFEIHMDIRVFGYALLLSVVSAVFFGLLPALQAGRMNLVAAMKEESHSTIGGSRVRLRNGFVAAQISLLLVLLICGSLFLRSLQRASSLDPGFRITNGALLSVDLSAQGYTKEEAIVVYRTLRDRIAALPGVLTAAWARVIPLGYSFLEIRTYFPGTGEEGSRTVAFNLVEAGYFTALDVRVLRGRAFSDEEKNVVLINETMASQFWPDEDALGKQMAVEGPEGPFLEIIGIVKDGKYNKLGERPQAYAYLPFSAMYSPEATLVVRTDQDPRSLFESIRHEHMAVAPNLPVVELKTVEEHMRLALYPARMTAGLLAVFGVLGLLLAAVGIYGVIAYTVALRTQEIGIRLSLGADRRIVIRMILMDALRLAAPGIATGLLLSFVATRFLSGMLFGIHPADPVTFAVVPTFLLSIVLLASYFPARKAGCIDPAVALRYQ